MEMYIRVKDNVITDAKFKTFGCGAAIATSSMVTDLVKGKTIEEALKISNQAVVEALGGLPPVKLHCSVLAEDALKSAIDDYLKKTTGKGLPGFKPHNEPLEEHEHS
jgi:nitrogen fixation NifU-like protein